MPHVGLALCKVTTLHPDPSKFYRLHVFPSWFSLGAPVFLPKSKNMHCLQVNKSISISVNMCIFHVAKIGIKRSLFFSFYIIG